MPSLAMMMTTPPPRIQVPQTSFFWKHSGVWNMQVLVLLVDGPSHEVIPPRQIP